MIFSNSAEDTARRLLDLYPVELVKKEYQVTGSTEAAYDQIVNTNSFADIKENALRLMGVCRQHIYLFRHNHDIAAHSGDFVAKNMGAENITRVDGVSLSGEFLIEQNYKFLEVNNRTVD